MADWTKTRFNLRYHWATITLRIVAFVCLMLGIGVSQGDAWVDRTPDYQPFPAGEATVVMQRFCWSAAYCDQPTDRAWRDMIQAAIDIWNGSGSSFLFHTQPARASDDPCSQRPGTIFVIFTHYTKVCPGDQPLNQVGWGRMNPGRGWARIYINENELIWTDQYPYDDALTRSLVGWTLLHEFGHILGLGHPNRAGQKVRAIMNQGWAASGRLALWPDDIAGAQALYPPVSGPFIGFLENPGDGSSRSGIGIISGWVCEAEEVVVYIAPAQGQLVQYEAAYGTERTDTEYTKDGEEICGDTDNGFGLLFNWNRLGNGTHEVMVLVDQAIFARALVTVTTLDAEFLRGAEGTYTLEDFPEPGRSVVVRWEQSLQNFVIIEQW